MAKKKIFSGKITPRQAAFNALEWQKIQARRTGVELEKPKSLKTADILAAAEAAAEAIAEAERKRKEEKEKKEKMRRRAAVAQALMTGDKHAIITALMCAAEPEERVNLRGYDSDDVKQIAAIYIANMEFSVSDAIAQWEAQRSEAFADQESGDYDVNWGDIF